MKMKPLALAAILASTSLLSAAPPATEPSQTETLRDWRYLLTIHEIARADDDTRLATLVQENSDRTRSLLDGQTPVHVAAQAGALKSLRVLAKAGADLNYFDSRHRTPLSIAIAADFTNTADTLISLHADPNLPATDGKSDVLSPPLVLAAARGNDQIVKSLLAAKADVNAKASDGAFALTAAAAAAHWSTVNALLEGKADPNAHDAKGVTALLMATEAGDEKAVAALLEKGADPKIMDNAGRAALSLTESPTLWKMLIAKGADVNVVAGGSTPLQYFIAAGKKDLVKAWLDYKPDPLVPDRKGHTAKELARLYASQPSPSYETDMARREIAQLIEAYQDKFAAEQEAADSPAPSPK